jgi:hypothetical protein
MTGTSSGMKLLLDTITRRQMTGISFDMKLLLDTITCRQWQEHHLWCPTTVSCQMMFLSLSTCNGVQQQFHVRWCSCHCLRVMVSNNSFMSDDVPVIVYVQWCPTTISCQMMFLSLSTCNGVQQWNCCWTPLHVDNDRNIIWHETCWTPLHVENDRNIIWHETVVGHHYT